ncbi:adhesion G-protein coupled receptor G2-like [Sycon ciliatum]|uniref:adhesion G-protein coupled receptor G2-like n=1 Tax=Sycon ciliatum TaxID=27933 RepID=UPI0031F63346
MFTTAHVSKRWYHIPQNQCLPRPIVVRGVESSVNLSILTNPVFVNGSTILTCMVTSLSTVQSMSIVRKHGSQSTVIKILDAGNFMPPVLNPETKVWHNSVSYLVPNVETTAKYACNVTYFGGVQNISSYTLLQAVPRQTAELHECKTIVEQQLCEQGSPGEQLCETFKQQICFDGYPHRHCNYSLQLELLPRSKAFFQSFEVHIGIQDQESYAMNNNSAHISPFVFYTLGGELHVPNHDTDATVYKLHGHHPGQTLQLFLVQEHSRKLELLCPTMAHRRDLTCCGGNATYRMDVRADRPGSERRIVLDILCHDCDTCCSPNEEMVSARVRADLYSAFPTAEPTTKITSPSADSVASSMPTVTMVTSPTTLGNITASAATGDSVASAPGIPASTPVSVQMFTQSTSPEPSTETTSPEPSTETTSPELSTETTSPELSTETTSPELSTETTSPELSTETTSPELSTETTSPELSTETTIPELSTETTSPELSTETTSPELSTETTSPELSTETTSPELSTETTNPELSTSKNAALSLSLSQLLPDLDTVADSISSDATSSDDDPDPMEEDEIASLDKIIDKVEQLSESVSNAQFNEKDVDTAVSWVSSYLSRAKAISPGATIPKSLHNRLFTVIPNLLQPGSIDADYISVANTDFVAILSTRASASSKGKIRLDWPEREYSRAGGNSSDQPEKAGIVSVQLPSMLFQELGNTSDSASVMQLSIVLNGSIFGSPNADDIPDVRDPEDVFGTPVSSVINLQVGHNASSNLPEPVRISLAASNKTTKLGGANGSVVCAFWNTTLRSNTGGWSRRGCSLVSNSANTITCECNHLTSFALIQSLFPRGPSSGPSETQRNVTLYGLAISSLFLIATVLVLLLFRKLRVDIANRLLCHYCMVMLVLNVITVVNQSITPSPWRCTVINVLTHYTLLTLYLWALVQALHLYRLLVTVFYKEVSHIHRKAIVVCYGVPCLVCLLTMASRRFSMDNYSGYNERNLCQMRTIPDGVVALLVPVNAIVLFNLVIFVRVMHVSIRQSSSAVKSSVSTRRLVRVGTGTFLALGLSWILGMFSVVARYEWLKILFSVALSACGMLIFITKVLLSQQVRTAVSASLERTMDVSSRHGRKSSAGVATVGSGDIKNNDNRSRLPRKIQQRRLSSFLLRVSPYRSRTSYCSGCSAMRSGAPCNTCTQALQLDNTSATALSMQTLHTCVSLAMISAPTSPSKEEDTVGRDTNLSLTVTSDNSTVHPSSVKSKLEEGRAPFWV